jgi:hypothetical protein
LICARTGLHGTADTTGSGNSNRLNDLRKKMVGREDHLGRRRARCALWVPIATRAVHHVIRAEGDKVIVQHGLRCKSAPRLIEGCQTERSPWRTHTISKAMRISGALGVDHWRTAARGQRHEAANRFGGDFVLNVVAPDAHEIWGQVVKYSKRTRRDFASRESRTGGSWAGEQNWSLPRKMRNEPKPRQVAENS